MYIRGINLISDLVERLKNEARDGPYWPIKMIGSIQRLKAALQSDLDRVYSLA